MGKTRLKRILPTLFAAFMFIFFLYFSFYYRADTECSNYLKGTKDVKVTEDRGEYLFDGKGKDTLLIFYPGAKVEEISYAPLMERIAEKGIDCYLVKLPLRFALFNVSAADDAVKKTHYSRYVLSGHSLGGVACEMHAADNPDTFRDVILLAAYPSRKAGNNQRMLSVYGENDGVLNLKRYEGSRKNRPKDYTEAVITGGNHAGFGNYGDQRGDGKAELSSRMQQEKSAKLITDWLNR